MKCIMSIFVLPHRDVYVCMYTLFAGNVFQAGERRSSEHAARPAAGREERHCSQTPVWRIEEETEVIQ